MKKSGYMLIIWVVMGGVFGIQGMAQDTKKEQPGITERVSGLEKGQSGLQYRYGEIRSGLTEQQRYTDSVCQSLQEWQSRVLSQEDSARMRDETLATINRKLETIDKRFENRKNYALVGIVVLFLAGIFMAGMLVMQRKSVLGLRQRLDEVQGDLEHTILVLQEKAQSIASENQRLSQAVVQVGEQQKTDAGHFATVLSTTSEDLLRQIEQASNSTHLRVSESEKNLQSSLGEAVAALKKKMQALEPKLQEVEQLLKDHNHA